MHVRVLTLNAPPEGTSGVRVVVKVEEYAFTLEGEKSQYSTSSRISHLVCLGPTEPVSGLM